MVEVEWIDPGGVNGWHSAAEAEEAWTKVQEPIHSLGYLLEDSERGVSIVGGYGRNGEMLDNSTTIPRANVVKVTRLRR